MQWALQAARCQRQPAFWLPYDTRPPGQQLITMRLHEPLDALGTYCVAAMCTTEATLCTACVCWDTSQLVNIMDLM